MRKNRRKGKNSLTFTDGKFILEGLDKKKTLKERVGLHGKPQRAGGGVSLARVGQY